MVQVNNIFFRSKCFLNKKIVFISFNNVSLDYKNDNFMSGNFLNLYIKSLSEFTFL